MNELWDRRFLEMAELVSNWSKDSTSPRKRFSFHKQRLGCFGGRGIFALPALRQGIS